VSAERIEQLVRELDVVADPAARSAARELMSALMEMHGAALARIVEDIGPEQTRRIAADEVVRSVLLLYELHPDDVQTRVHAALEQVQPYIRSHGGRIEVTAIENGVVRLHLEGSCDGCPSSAQTVKGAIERAIFAAAPEITEVVADEANGGSHGEVQTRVALAHAGDEEGRRERERAGA